MTRTDALCMIWRPAAAAGIGDRARLSLIPSDRHYGLSQKRRAPRTRPANACRDNRSVLYQRAPRMFGDLALARGDGRYPRLMRALGGVKLLILDDWGLEPLGPEQHHDLLEIIEDRYGRGATLITSQIPVDHRWHDLIGEPTLADAILDRIIHNAHRLQLHGDSLRKRRRSTGRRSGTAWAEEYRSRR
jgi:hypothetical protein